MLVAEDLGGRPGRDQLPEVDDRGRLQRAETRLMSWSTRMTSAPTCSGIRWITSDRCPVSSSGSPAAGSSSSTTRSLPTTARATSTSLRSRGPSPRSRALRRRLRPTNAIAPAVLAARRALRPRVLVDHRHVVEDRQLLDRHLGLERPPQPPARAAEVGHLQQVLAEGGDRAGRRLDEAAEHVEERRLAGAVWADQPARSSGETTLMSSIGVTPAKRTVRS